MAFSTFRGLEASGANSGPPPFAGLGSYNEVACMIGNPVSGTGTNPNGNGAILSSTTSNFFTAYKANDGAGYACMVTPHVGYTTTGTPVTFQAGINGLVCADNVSSTGFLVAYSYTPLAVANLSVAYYTASGATLTLATGPTDYILSAGNASTYVACCVLDTSNGIIMGSDAAGNCQFKLIDPIALTTISTPVSPVNIPIASTSPTQPVLVGMSSVLAGLFYIDQNTPTDLYCAGIDRVTTNITYQTPVKLTTGKSGASFAVSKISATDVIVSYEINTTTIGARIITVAASGVITVGAETTFVTGSTVSNRMAQSTVLSSSLALLSFRTNNIINGNVTFVLAASIVGSAITFGSAKYVSVSGVESVPSGGTIPGVRLASVTATRAAALYHAQAGSITGINLANIGYGTTIDYVASLPAWGGTYAGTHVNSTAQTFGIAAAVTRNQISVGSDRILTSVWNAATGAAVYWASVQMDTVSANINISSKITKVCSTSGNFSGGSNQCRIYADNINYIRCLGVFYDGSNAVQFGVIEVDNGGGPTMGTLNSGFSNNWATNFSSNVLVNLDTDSSLYIQGSGATVSGTYRLQASLITTSGATVSTIGALTNVDATTGSSFKCYPKFAKALSSTVAAVVYMSDINSGTQSAAYVGIIDVSSGTPVLVTSAALTPSAGFSPQSYCDGAFTTGNTGILIYANASNSSSIGVGFSYTTSTVTVSGSTTTLGADLPNVFANGSAGVSATEILTILDTNYYLLTMSNINTITIGSPTATGVAANYSYLIPAENNNAVIFSNYGNGATSSFGYVYRG